MMNKKEFKEFHEDFTAEMKAINQAKQDDYTGFTEYDDPFANFKIVESIGITDPVTGLLTRMSDKLARLASYNKTGRLSVRSEGVTDTCLDLANYSALLAALVEELNTPDNA